MKHSYYLLSFILTSLITQALNADIPVAGYSYYIEFVGAGSEVYFLNESIDGETYLWDFGDGATSTELNPVHAYPEPGLFIVCITATNDLGSDTYCDTINTYYPPFADFAFSGDPEVTFTDMSTNYPESWDWFFGDGGTSDLQNPIHTYLANGDYEACLSVNNPGGTSYVCRTVTITSYAETVANFIYTGDPEVSFTDLSTLDPFAWSWDFGDGTLSTEQNPVHVYADNGIYDVCLQATNAGGADTYCEEIEIGAAVVAPVADFTYVVIGLEAAFVDNSTNDPFEWSWDFGDGTFSSEQNPLHVFGEAGNYTVCLTATNGGGSDEECREIVTVATSISEQEAIGLSINVNGNSLIINSSGDFNADEFYTYSINGSKLELHFTGRTADISKLTEGVYISRYGNTGYAWMKTN